MEYLSPCSRKPAFARKVAEFARNLGSERQKAVLGQYVAVSMGASSGYGPIKVAQGIVGYADLALGDRVEPVLEALIRAGGGRLSGVRLPPRSNPGRRCA